MPRSDGRSCFTTTAWWCFKPSASSVRRSNAGRPMPERTCRIRRSPLPGGGSGRSRPGLRLRYFRVGGSLAMGHFLARPVRDGLELDAALLGDAPRRREVLQRIQRGPHHVVRVGGAEALGEEDRKSTRLNSSHSQISYAVFCLKKKRPQTSHPGGERTWTVAYSHN